MKRFPSNFDSLYKNLNQSQKEAVDAIEGPVLVIAGPGTGKTQVLTMRIANILRQTDTPSSAILALTFTESGVKAMRERLLSIIGPEAYYAGIYTFHSFCSDVLKSNPDSFVVAEDLEPLSDLERIQVFREIIDQGQYKVIKPFGSRYYYVRALIKTIQDLKREGISHEEFLDYIKASELEEKELLKLTEVADVYKNYQNKILSKGRYDFEDMISLVTEKLEKDEMLLRDYQEKYLYILVDEYQDTNSSQNRVVSMLANFWGQDANVFAVGDDSQSIYRFQGASIENLLYFKNQFPEARVVVLNENYRSQSLVISSADDVIKNNEVKISDFIEGIDKTQISKATYPPLPIQVGHFSSGITEGFYVAQKIKELIDGGVPPSEISVIYRNNSDSRDFTDLLSKMNINFNLVGGENVLENHDINKLLKLFNVILKARTKDDDLDLFTVLNYEFLKFDYVDVLKLSRFASEKKLNYIEAIEHPDFSIPGKIKDPEKFKVFLQKIYEWQDLDSNVAFTQFFEKVLEHSGFLNWVLESSDSIEKLNKLNSLFAEIKRLNIADHSLNLEKFMIDVSILRESGIPINEEDLNIRNNSVLLTTAHRSKGLEFEHVFIVKCFDSKWGNNKTRELIKLPEGLITSALTNFKKSEYVEKAKAAQKEKNEDERRLFYVALTRAKKAAYITYADSYFTEGSQKEAVPSMFISEIQEEKKEKINVEKYESSVKEILKDLISPIQKTNISIDEKDFLKTVIANFSLSVTALNTYLECAYKFKLNNLLRTPRAKNKHMSFGTAVHFALDKFFKLYRDEKTLPSKEMLVDTFNQALANEVLSKVDFDECTEKGATVLNAYYEFHKASMGKPMLTEKFFGYGYGKIFLDSDIPLNGKVDKIDIIDWDKKLVKVVDYKTGSPKSKNDIEGNTKYSDGGYKRQLVFYKLLADLDKTFTYTVAEAELDFVEPDKKGQFVKHSFEISEEEVLNLKKIIREAMTGIRAFLFERTTNYTTCSNCEFKDHCWPNGLPKPQQQELALE